MSTAALDMPTKPKPATNSTPAGRAVPRPDTLDRIVLTGFMGSGKTTAGALLADRLGWRFLDLDHEIESRHQRSVPDIFAEYGEAHFRHLESATLASLLGQRRAVIALGGGAPEELGNRLLLEQTPHTAVVYLSANFDTLIARCADQATARPNLADLNLAERRFRLRRPHYERIAAHTIHTTNLSPGQTVDSILTAIRQPKSPR
jgi:shikimate kinase